MTSISQALQFAVCGIYVNFDKTDNDNLVEDFGWVHIHLRYIIAK